MKYEEIYISGEYLERHPGWHAEFSFPKARDILNLLRRADIRPRTICEVGCGVGEILVQLQKDMDESCTFWGYDISPQAIEQAREKENKTLHFRLAEMTKEDAHFDLLMMIDMIEHVENCYSFLRQLHAKSSYTLLQLSLDLTAMALLFHPNDLLGFQNTQGHIGHLHYFTKPMALAMFEDLGYEIVAHTYTRIPPHPSDPWRHKLIGVVRDWLYAINKDVAVRLFGGYKLLVLLK